MLKGRIAKKAKSLLAIQLFSYSTSHFMTKKQYISDSKSLQKLLHKIAIFFQNLGKEQRLMIGFSLIFLVAIGRLVQLQIIDFQEYQSKLINQHFQHVNIQAKRGNILVESPSGKFIQLTANTQLYDLYVDPKFVINKPKMIEEVYPHIVKHLCPLGADAKVADPYNCLLQLEKYTGKDLLPPKPTLYYL